MQPTLDSSSTTDALEHLSGKETREIVTPYAFGVSPDLFGKKLATPTRRAVAQIIDLSLVALLSNANALFLGFFVALTFFRAGQRMSLRGELTITRRVLRLLAAILLFWVTFSLVQLYNAAQDTDGIEIVGEEKAGPVLTMVQRFALNGCEAEQQCLNNVASQFGEAMGETTTTREEALSALGELLEGRGLSEEQRATYHATFMQAFDNAHGALIAPMEPLEAKQDIEIDSAAERDVPPPEAMSAVDQEYSVVKWIKGIFSDLGLGFGWAALYYSVFTAWWQGHTPGKRLVNIKVLKLDGSALTLWESFGRYGGYGAGLATGLLGYIQIYWDANRQAIQDKISETLVIYDENHS